MAQGQGLTKRELCAQLAKRLAVPRAVAREFFVELEFLAERELLKGGVFAIPGIVTLVVDRRPDRMGRHLYTGEPMKMALKARLSQRFKDTVMGRPNRAGRRRTGRTATII